MVLNFSEWFHGMLADGGGLMGVGAEGPSGCAPTKLCESLVARNPGNEIAGTAMNPIGTYATSLKNCPEVQRYLPHSA